MAENTENKKLDVIKAINRNIRILNSVVLIVVFTLFFVNIRTISTILKYVPPFSVVTMLVIVSVLVIISLFIARMISKNAISEITDYDSKVNALLMSNKEEIAERKSAQENLKKAHEKLEDRVKERTSELLKSVRSLKEHITERKRAEVMIQFQLKRLNSLRSTERAIAGSFDLRVTLDIILDQVTTQMGIDAASILLLNQHTQVLEYVVSKGFRTNALKYTRLKLGESNAGRAAIERRIVTVPNLTKNPEGFVRSKPFTSEEFVTYFAVPLIARGQVSGVLELFNRFPLNPDPEWLEFLETIANQAAIAIDNASLFEGLQRSHTELTLAYDTTIEGWSRAMDLRDKETEGHTRRVTDMTVLIAGEIGLKEEEIIHIRRGALLHDMGKMGVPDNILLKPGPLTEKEWKVMRKHPAYAYEMLYPIEYLRPSLDIPYCHHEKWDGSGYPRKLKGSEIPLAARMFAVADVFDAACSDRPYRPGCSKEKAQEFIRLRANTHFDPEITDIFLKMKW